MPLDEQIELSVVIPCFNEGKGISYLVSKLGNFEERLNEFHELIFVDDGSIDATYEKLTNLYKDRIGKTIKIVRHPQNRGVGAAVRTGILNSHGHYVAAIDSDCTYEPTHLIEMLKIIKKEDGDVITASPLHPKGSIFNVPLYRIFLSRNLSNLYNIVLGNKIYTYTSMFRIYRAETIKNVDFKSNGFLAMAEILIKMHKKGYKIIEYPTTLTVRKYGVSNARVSKMIKEHLIFIAKILLKREDI